MDCLNFNSMKFGSAQVRRLSTVSSVIKPPYFVLTTEWLWYWTDESGAWQEYGKQVSGDGGACAAGLYTMGSLKLPWESLL